MTTNNTPKPKGRPRKYDDKRHIHLLLDAVDLYALDQVCADKGITRTEAVQEAIADYMESSWSWEIQEQLTREHNK